MFQVLKSMTSWHKAQCYISSIYSQFFFIGSTMIPNPQPRQKCVTAGSYEWRQRALRRRCNQRRHYLCSELPPIVANPPPEAPTHCYQPQSAKLIRQLLQPSNLPRLALFHCRRWNRIPAELLGRLAEPMGQCRAKLT